MWYLRLIIGVVFIVLGTKLGKNKGLKYKNAYNFWSSVVSFCNDLNSDLLYKKSNLNEFLNKNYLSSDFTFLLNEYIKNGKINDFPEYFSNDDKLEFVNFLSSIGKSDSLSQMQILDAYKSKFAVKLAEKDTEFKKFYSVSLKLGFAIGLGFMIMVI